MSDNMEHREKNQRLRLTKEKEEEEEKMKHELTDIGMYEAGMTYEEMKSFLEAINQSKHSSNTSNNKNTQKELEHSDKEYLPEITPDANGSQVTLQEANSEISSPSFRLNLTTPTIRERKAHYSSSPESPLFEIRNKRQSSDSDEIFEKQLSENVNSTHNTNRFSLLTRSGSALRECQNATEKRTAQDIQFESLERKLERWRLNPLNVSVNEKDVPLRQPNRPQARERVPFRFCTEAHTSEQCEMIQAISQHLKKMRELWYSWQPATHSTFQWGSPIQVGTANGSLDRKPLTNSKAEQIKAECTYKNNYERACKRKANSIIAQSNKESSTEDESDEQSNFVRIKKKKLQCDNKMNKTERNANQHAHTTSDEKATSMISHQRPSSNYDNNDNPKNTRKRKTVEKGERLSPDLDTCPRRIVPPTPKARLSLNRYRKENAAKSKLSQQIPTIVEQTESQQKDKAMTSEEIRKKLEEDWHSSEEDFVVAKDVELRPRPIPKSIQLKLRKRLALNKTETNVSFMTTAEKNDRTQGTEVGSKFYEQQKKKENLSRTKNRNRSREDDSSDDEKKLSKKVQAYDVSTSSSNINCPICNKLFPHNEIEDHAANCEQFDTYNESSDNDQLECNVCNNYKTHKMTEYGEHVNLCIQKKLTDNKKYSRESDVDTVSSSTSSFRTFKPISEQKDSEIDYLGQFSSNKTSRKTKISSGKKRKH